MGYEIRPLAAEHAAAAAVIHAEGQPGTFLTSLGPAFLRALYGQIAISPYCYGYVAMDADQVIGICMATTDSDRIFRDVILRRGIKLVPSIALALIRHPSLVSKIWETLFYPSQVRPEPGEAEWLYIGVRQQRQDKGLGRSLLQALIEETRRRGMTAMGCIVDAQNKAALRFHENNGLRPIREFTIYGRPMVWYRLLLNESEVGSSEGLATP